MSAFLLTLVLTEGAPLRPPTPGEGNWPAATTRALPLPKPERPKPEQQGTLANSGAADVFLPAENGAPAPVVNPDRDAQIYITLFGVPRPGFAPSP